MAQPGPSQGTSCSPIELTLEPSILIRLPAFSLSSIYNTIDLGQQFESGILKIEYSSSNTISIRALPSPTSVEIELAIGEAQAMQFLRDRRTFVSNEVRIFCPSFQDAERLAADNGIYSILLKTRPKFARLDLHPSCVEKAKREFWGNFVLGITSAEYSIQWDVVEIEASGGVAADSRLQVIICCPGEELPGAW